MHTGFFFFFRQHWTGFFKQLWTRSGVFIARSKGHEPLSRQRVCWRFNPGQNIILSGKNQGLKSYIPEDYIHTYSIALLFQVCTDYMFFFFFYFLSILFLYYCSSMSSTKQDSCNFCSLTITTSDFLFAQLPLLNSISNYLWSLA